MKKKNFILSIAIALPFLGSAMYQEAPADSIWDVGGNFAFNVQQAGFSNWAKGGEGSISWGTVLNVSAIRTGKNNSWKNSLQAGYGFISRGNSGLRKNADLLIIQSNYGLHINKNWEFNASIDIRSQFDNGYKFSVDSNTGEEIRTLVSTFLAPGYVQPSLGFGYKEGKRVNATLSPISNKLTIVLEETLSDLGRYGVDPGSKLRSQLGAAFAASYQEKIMDNVSLKTKLLLFGAYEDLGLWDVNYDLFINFKVNKYISTNFLLQLIYDDDIRGNSDDPNVVGPALQIRNVLNFGLNIKF